MKSPPVRRTRPTACFTAIAPLVAVAAGGCGGAGDSAAVSGEGMRVHMEALASDEMRGREAGTEGYRAAADYVASRFGEWGLAPLGDGESDGESDGEGDGEGDGAGDGPGAGFLQKVPFLETRLVPGSASLTLTGGDEVVRLKAGRDFVRAGGFGEAVESVTAPLLFAGFGITAPEYDHDDFAGVDATGRILVVFTGAPPGFAPDERAFYSSSAGKQRLAVERGAVGILTIRTPVDRERLTWPRMQAAAGSSAMRWLEGDGAPHDAFSQLAGDAWLSESGAGRLFELAGRDLEALFEYHGAGGTGAFDLGVTASLTRESGQHRTAAPNVVGLLRGGDLADEYVLVSAHLDGLGVGADGAIYNGAYDNAAGVATVLEVASAMVRRLSPPRRSVIFAAVTAEEKGLRGSDFLAHHPPVPIDRIVANINVDMPFLGYPVADVEGFGVEHSTLRGILLRAAAQAGVVLTPDPRPELVRLIRSDQFSFVRQGVPGLNLQPGNASSDPAIDGAGLRAAFLREHYHQPSDDLSLAFSEEGATRFARLVFSFTLQVANAEERPRWLDGDFFGERFASPPAAGIATGSRRSLPGPR